jgi:hypothetical protein
MSDWWTLLVVSIPLLVMWVGALVEVVRRRDLAGRARVLWVLALLVVSLPALAVYAVLRPPRALRVSGAGDGQQRAVELVVLAERRQRGEIDDAEFARLVGR